MIPVLIEAAARSLLLGLAVAVVLRIFRVRNVPAQKAAWKVVLLSALAMPLLLAITAQWHLLPAGVNVILPADPMTRLEELQARILAKSGSGSKVAPLTSPAPQNALTRSQESPVLNQAAGPRADEVPPRAAGTLRADEPEQEAVVTLNSPASPSPQLIVNSASYVEGMRFPEPIRHIIVSPVSLAFTLYCGIATLFLARLALGLFTAIRLWRAATPILARVLPYDAASLRIRVSDKVASPLTIGSAIVLPADCTGWDSEKLRIVLAHERSHIEQGDFYLQLLAAVYAALVWFSPLGWWLKHELAELAEAISDRAGMKEAASCTSYAQILLEFAAAPRRVSIGVAMARPGSLSRRIERLLNDHAFRQCFAGGRRALIAVTLVPMALFVSTTLVRVQAAAATQFPSSGATGLAVAHASSLGGQTLPELTVTSTIPGGLPEPKALATTAGSEAATGVAVIQATSLSDQMLPELSVTPTDLRVFAEPKSPVPTTAPVMVAAASPAPLLPKAGGGPEGVSLFFDRTLSVNGTPKLSVSTGSGNIHITHGSGNQIRIHGLIHVSEDGNEEQARQLASNPPIEQSGDTIRVGLRQEQWRDQERWHGISIDYQIEAPAGTVLAANSGSGDVVDEGVGQNAKLQTGSGNVTATSLEGPFTVRTGSGNIVAEQTGQGDVTAETGSGDIELKSIHGGFHGQTGSGNIKATGTPSASWTLQTGSGTIELWTNNAPVTLDASTGSGSVTTEHEMVMQGSLDPRHVRGTLNGGGPTIRVQTGSGDIQLH